MTQSSLALVNQPGASFRAANNTAHQANATFQAGAVAPPITYPYQIWIDTVNSKIKRRDGANTGWNIIAGLISNTIENPYRGGVPLGDASIQTLAALTGVLGFKKGADKIASTTVDLSSATGNYLHITGSATITGFGTVQAGTAFFIVFDGASTLTYNAASLILPGGANIVTAAGDAMIISSEGAGNWRVQHYARADGTALKTVGLPVVNVSFSVAGLIKYNPGAGAASVVKNGVGDWTVNYANAFVNAASQVIQITAGNYVTTNQGIIGFGSLPQATSCHITYRDYFTATTFREPDVDFICLTVWGDLA